MDHYTGSMTRRSNQDRERALALVLARELRARGYWNFSGLRWRNDTKVLTRKELALMCLSWHPEAIELGFYLESHRFFDHLAFAALQVRREP